MIDLNTGKHLEELNTPDKLKDSTQPHSWNYTKSYYRLKYFYHINIDSLIKKVTDILPEYSNSSVFESFFAIFKQILISSKQYHSFLTEEGPHNESFFGEAFFSNGCCSSYNVDYNNGYSDLIKIALMNYCISQSFYIFSPTVEDSNYVKLTGRLHEKYYKSSLPDGSISAQYTNRYSKFFNKPAFKNYIDEMPHEQCFLRNADKSSSKQRLSLSPYFAHWGFFAFYENDIFNFCNCIHRVSKIDTRAIKSILLKYDTVSSLLSTHLKYWLNNAEKDTTIPFTFAEPAQYFFATDTLNYIYRVYNAFEYPTQVKEEDKYLTKLKPLDGNTLSKEFLDVLKMPNVFSRHFFLDIALRSIANAETAPRYLRNPDQPNQMMFLDSRYLKDQTQYNAYLSFNAPQLLSNYIQHLSQLLLPLLLDLWYVTLHNIYGKNEAFSQVETYCRENSYILISDFTRLETDDITSFGEDVFMNTEEDTSMSLKYEKLYNMCKKQFDLLPDSDFHKNITSETAKKISELIKNRFPANPHFYPQDKDISSKIFLPYPDNNISTKKNDLVQKYISNLFNSITL